MFKSVSDWIISLTNQRQDNYLKPLLAQTEEPIPKEKTCVEGFKLACEKCFEKEVSIAIGFHAKKHLINHHGQVKRLLDEVSNVLGIQIRAFSGA